ncbi:TPA: hypothetical protein NJ458_003368 [Vibrio parahaemolyticus]|uniref:hypothetical protein n=1 Tax=Vibrio parahaemolyticus TaxID=670 RepID=UPI0011229C4F|nr:hypothetical protein [Vibrio parahaemolyticus]EGU0167941.1 hypothetical protein [Vibrio parahaemolyticus]EHH1170570.1 hypothetical protein [Vibrio parahaemolyticus]ELA9391248.1 hypothetical protein [Vibrio parahaemolyticus]MBE4110893.1 hypothetical protein [Vibrio parahaemolyticus]MBE4403103.1 hypothetical protein [Vibrio parahaemolyticus]
MGQLADSGKYGYGISKADKAFNAKAPLYRGERQKRFSSILLARQWQLINIHNEWGMQRFELIKKGRLSVLRKFGCGVSVRKSKSTMRLADGSIAEYPQYGVFWYDNEHKPKSKFFSPKKYGEYAEIEANWFAARKRAELTNSELNLPYGLTPYSFDLTA